MSAVLSAHSLVSPEEYLAGELVSETRHEFIAGVIHAMAGASAIHNTITHNLGGSLYNHLRGKPCQPFGSDMKLRLNFGADTVFYYPDAMVVCDPTDDATYYRERPVLIIEVLSPETARVDQREKLLAYRTLPSLEVYVLVDQELCRLTCYRRGTNWTPEFLTAPDDLLAVPALGWSIPLRDVYERTGLAG
jgi:Uma2 family endonuclease